MALCSRDAYEYIKHGMNAMLQVNTFDWFSR